MNECAPYILDNRKLAALGVDGAGGGDSEPGIPGSGLAGCCLSAVVSHGLPLSPVGLISYGGFPQTRPSLENQPRERKSEYIAGVPRRLLNNVPYLSLIPLFPCLSSPQNGLAREFPAKC